VLQPLVVTPNAKGTYDLIYGERRLRASQIAHLVTVPCIVREATPLQVAVWGLIENEQRADLNPMERALWYGLLSSDHKMTHEEIANITGKSRSTVSNTLRLLKLPQDVQDLVLRGELDESSARELLRVEDEGKQLEIAEQIIATGEGKRMVAERVDAAIGRVRPEAGTVSKVAYSPVVEQTPPPATNGKPTVAPAVVTKNYVTPNSDERLDIPLAKAQRQPDNSAVVVDALADGSDYQIAVRALRKIAYAYLGQPNSGNLRAMHSDLIQIAEDALTAMNVS
jgi:ParB/RepB/Spo0J family partition protein